MPALPPPSRHRFNRVAERLPRLIDMLDELDLPDRRTPLPPGFAGPRLRLINDMRRCLGKTPFQLPKAPPPGDLFVALAVTLKAAKQVLERGIRTANRHTYSRSRRPL